MNFLTKALLWSIGICANDKEERHRRHREAIDYLRQELKRSREIIEERRQNPKMTRRGDAPGLNVDWWRKAK